MTERKKTIHLGYWVSFLFTFGCGLALVVGFTYLISRNNPTAAPTYLSLTLAGALGGILYSISIDGSLELPKWGDNGYSVNMGSIGEIFLGIGGAFIAYVALPEQLKSSITQDTTQLAQQLADSGVTEAQISSILQQAAEQVDSATSSLTAFVTGLVGGYGGKAILNAALGRVIGQVKNVSLVEENRKKLAREVEQLSAEQSVIKQVNQQLQDGLPTSEVYDLVEDIKNAPQNIQQEAFTRAKEIRRLSWRTKAFKSEIPKTIPIFEALVESNPGNHQYHAQLGYAYKDSIPPRLEEAIAQINEAIALRGNQIVGTTWKYELNRALARIMQEEQQVNTNGTMSPWRQEIWDDIVKVDRNYGITKILIESQDEAVDIPLKDWLEVNQDWVQQQSGGTRLLEKAFNVALGPTPLIEPRILGENSDRMVIGGLRKTPEMLKEDAKSSSVGTRLLRRKRSSKSDLLRKNTNWKTVPPRTKIEATQLTYLKRYTLSASDLPDDQKVEVPMGEHYYVRKYAPAEDGHYLLELDYGYGVWYIWPSHWHLPWTNEKRQHFSPSSPSSPSSSPIPVPPQKDLSLSLQGSVGVSGNNYSEDVKNVKKRFKELGFNWFNDGNQADQGLIQAIKLFQSIVKGRTTVQGDGRIDVGGLTHQWLQAANAPRWVLMPIEGKGFVNYERKDNSDDHDYGTNWLADTITAAGKYYEDNYRRGRSNISPIPINDVSRPHGGFTKDHGGHQCGNACDIYLPRKGGGHGLSNWTLSQYDRNAARAILKALHAQPLVRKNKIYFNDTTLIKEGLCKSLGGHHHHIHFEVDVPRKTQITQTPPIIQPPISIEETKPMTQQGFNYVYPPINYGGRQFIVTIPDGYEQKALSSQDYARAADEFGLEVAVVRAVVEVEAAGKGFLTNEPAPARPKILFEAHWFYKLTPKPVSKTRPDLSSPKWNSSLYKGGSQEWKRLMDAMEFDPIPAMQSASWGLGQVMGFNYKVAGCSSVEQMVIEAHQGEYQQLRHMLNFCKNNNLISALQRKNWAAFAKGYNGPGYRKNNYDGKLASSYSRWRSKVG
ncbi:N-acetylmuramidase domain-containing protein [Crocosphaera sp.]|uniref:N-acetylmuramidase domain-containing protein n=1 Tax=Crocosphaera sp. TaxID=2729996 RepID=UPI003F2874C1|nr:N-acetylmuramidase domain-containing protein [Crocosphaera sp.]